MICTLILNSCISMVRLDRKTWTLKFVSKSGSYKAANCKTEYPKKFWKLTIEFLNLWGEGEEWKCTTVNIIMRYSKKNSSRKPKFLRSVLLSKNIYISGVTVSRTLGYCRTYMFLTSSGVFRTGTGFPDKT